MYLNNMINSIMLTIDFNNQEAYQGQSIWPFISFLLFFAGIVGVLVGIVVIVEAKREWHIYYGPNDKTATEEQLIKKKNFTKGIVVCAVSAMVFCVSFFVK